MAGPIKNETAEAEISEAVKKKKKRRGKEEQQETLGSFPLADMFPLSFDTCIYI